MVYYYEKGNMEECLEKENYEIKKIDWQFSLMPLYALQKCADNSVDEAKLNSMTGVEEVQNVIQKWEKILLGLNQDIGEKKTYIGINKHWIGRWELRLLDQCPS